MEDLTEVLRAGETVVKRRRQSRRRRENTVSIFELVQFFKDSKNNFGNCGAVHEC